MDLLVFLIFVTRSSMDLVFEALPIRVGGMNMTAGALLNLLILVIMAVLIVARFRASFPLKIWIPYLTIATFSVLWSEDRGASLRMLVVLFTYAAMFAAPFYLLARHRDNLWLLKASVYSSIIPVVYGFLEFCFFQDQSGRIKSTFYHPNMFGCYLNIIIGLICFLLATRTADLGRRARKILMLYLLPLIALVILTQARVAWAGSLFILVCFAFMVDRRYLLFLFLLPLVLFVPEVSNRLDDLNHGTQVTADVGEEGINSYAWRLLMWQSAWEDGANSRLLGKGLNSFGQNALRFFPLANDKSAYTDKGLGAHSVYVQTVYELGMVGLFCYLSMFVSLIVTTLRNLRIDKKGAIVTLAVIGAYLLQNYSDNMLDYGSVNLYFWGLVGTVFAKWSLQASAQRTAIKQRQQLERPFNEKKPDSVERGFRRGIVERT
jgi:O-antigen ligase